MKYDLAIERLMPGERATHYTHEHAMILGRRVHEFALAIFGRRILFSLSI